MSSSCCASNTAPVGPQPGGVLAFTYIATGAEGSDFFIPLPAVRPDDNYIAQVTCGGVSAIFGIDCPDLVAGDRTTVHFRVILTAAIQLDDRLDCFIIERT